MPRPSRSSPAACQPDLNPRVIRPPLVIQHSRLAGFRHHAAPRLWPVLRPGLTLTLAGEKDNPHDHQAVAIYWQGHKLGYLPRDENLVVSSLLARRRSLSARVRRLNPRAECNQRMDLEVLML